MFFHSLLQQQTRICFGDQIDTEINRKYATAAATAATAIQI